MASVGISRESSQRYFLGYEQESSAVGQIIALVPIALPDCAVPVLFERVCEALVKEIDHSLSSGLGPVIDLVSGPRVVI